MEIVAHRGSVNLPNSLTAFEEAIQAGATGIEADVCLTKDALQLPIIYHPGTTVPDLATLSWSEITNSYGHVSCLRQLLEYLADKKNVICMLDIKDPDPFLTEMLVWEVSKYHLKSRVYLTAPDRKIPCIGLYADKSSLIYAKQLCAEIKTNVIVTIPNDLTGIAKALNPNMLSFGFLQDSRLSKIVYRMFRHKFTREVAWLKRAGIKVMAGIADTEDEIKELIRDSGAKLDGIVTDYPLLAKKILT